MKRLVTSLSLVAMLIAGAVNVNVWAANANDAKTLIENTTKQVLEALKADPTKTHALVDKVVLAHFDFRKMSRLVLAKNWRKVSRKQKKDFIKEFRGLLIRTYSSALVEAAGKVSKIDYSVKKRGSKKAIVKSQVYQQGKATPIKVDYVMYYHKKKKAWKVYNVKVEGVSLVTNYRAEFSNDINKLGIEGLIEKIAKKAK
jgi:phospholipid transport system substrate-binding protein